jgi:hypothetical protein
MGSQGAVGKRFWSSPPNEYHRDDLSYLLHSRSPFLGLVTSESASHFHKWKDTQCSWFWRLLTVKITILLKYINFNINNERQDYKISIVWGGTSGRGKAEWWRFKWGYMVDGLHISIWNRIKKPLAIVLTGAERGLKGERRRGDVTNVQSKSNRNCRYESCLCN